MDPDYRLILDTLGEPVIAAERTGRIIYANPAAETLLGWPSGGLCGLPITAIVPPQLRSRHTAGFNRFRSTWQPQILGKGIRVSARRKNGVEVPIELTLTSFRGRGGQELYLATLHDRSRLLEPARKARSDAMGRVMESLTMIEAGGAGEAQFFKAIHRALEIHFDAGVCQLWFWDEPTTSLRAPLDHRGPAPGLPEIAKQCARTRTLVRVDGGDAPLSFPELEVRGALGVLCAIPITGGDSLLGVLVYGSRGPLPPELLPGIELLARSLSGFLERIRVRTLASSLERRERQLRLCMEFARRLSKLGPLPALEFAIAEALALTELDEAFLLERDRTTEVGRVSAHAGSKQLAAGELMQPESCAASLALRSGRTEVVPDHRELPHGSPQLRQRGVRAAVGVPIIIGGDVRAALQLASRKSGRHLTRDDMETAQLVAEQIAAALAVGR